MSYFAVALYLPSFKKKPVGHHQTDANAIKEKLSTPYSEDK